MKSYLLNISLLLNAILLLLFFSMAINYHLPGKIMWRLFGVADSHLFFDKKVVVLGDYLVTREVFKDLILKKDIVALGTRSGSIKDVNQLLKTVYKLNPEVCVITANGYDIYSGESPENVFNSYRNIIETLQKNNIKPVVQSALYAIPDKYIMEEYASDVGKLNTLLNNYCFQNSIKYLDLNSFLSNGNYLIAEYSSRGGFSPNTLGYELWVKKLFQCLQQ